MQNRWHYTSLILLLLVSVAALGYPEQNSGWFAGFSATDYTSRVLFYEVRLPRLMMAMFAGAGLSVCGLFLQTFFRNPLAGPSILGLTSGSHLFVAVFIMVGPNLTGVLENLGVSAAAGCGALVFSVFILLISRRIVSSVTLLLTGMLLGTFVSALTSLIQARADPGSLKAFTIWAMGSLQQPDTSDLKFLIPVVSMLMALACLFRKPLNAMILGDSQAQSLGVNVRITRNRIIICVAAMTGVITAFCGPIAFVGLIVPNVVRMVYKTGNHLHLILGCIFFGAIFLLLCEWFIIFLEPWVIIQINVLTSLLGAPFVILFMLKQKSNA